MEAEVEHMVEGDVEAKEEEEDSIKISTKNVFQNIE